jgi:DNA repair protein RadA/Sms
MDSQRVAMILAVLHRRVGVALAADDVYVATVGGARVSEPAADLALALALASARTDRPVRKGLVAIGEVALSGAVRPISAIGTRLSEAARLGFTHAIVPAGVVDAAREAAGSKVIVLGVETLADAVRAGIQPE